jgi:uncharacterized protein (TIGR00255 family)
MIYSMTGFGKSSVTIRKITFSVAIRTLNSKQCDLSIKLPSALRDLEYSCRPIISSALQRGKIDLSVSIDSGNNTHTEELVIDQELFLHYYNEFKNAIDLTGAKSEPDFSRILSLPGVLHNRSEFSSPLTQQEVDLFGQAIDQAIADTCNFREQEGRMLQQVLTKNVNNIRQLLKQIELYEAERIDIIKNRLQEQLSNLEDIAYDNGRLEQELIYYIEKLDINEEKNRLAHHLDYFVEIMDGEDTNIGKKLGFVAQEIGREINTLGSKSNSAPMQQLVVNMKDESEQIKEQVLNVL